MRIFMWLLALGFGGLLLTLVLLTAESVSPDSSFPTSERLRPQKNIPVAAARTDDRALLRRQPLSFVENRGQVGREARFHVEGAGHSVLFETERVVFHRRKDTGTSYLVLQFEGAQAEPGVGGFDPKPGVAHFYRGTDPSRWQTGVPTYGGVRYRDLYPGIDLVYLGEEGRLKSEFHVAPGTDPFAIRFRYDGGEAALRDDGALLLKTPLGELVEARPVAYQDVGGHRVDVAARYVLEDGGVRFALGTYDPAFPLVIDPEVTYASYAGGTGEDLGEAILADADGMVYFAGFTASNDFPTQSPLFGHAGLRDAFLSKVDPETGELLYSTYLGGSGHDQGTDLALGQDGLLFLAGLTASTDFPLLRPAQSTYGGGEADAFLAMFGANGSLLSSTYLGGNGNDQARAVAVNENNQVFVGGFTSSSNFFTFDAFQDTHQGNFDGFLTQYLAFGGDAAPSGTRHQAQGGNNAQFSPERSTYFGGNGDDTIEGLDILLNGVVVVGTTSSVDLLADGEINGGDYDAFLAAWHQDRDPVFADYLGGSGDDFGFDVAANGDVVTAVGTTNSPDFPQVNAGEGPSGDGFEAFVTNFFTPVGYEVVQSGTFGSTGYDDFAAVDVSEAGNIVTGGYSETGGGANGTAVVGTIDIDPITGTMTFKPYYPRGDADVLGVDWVKEGTVAVTGRSFGGTPVTNNAFQSNLAGDKDAYVAEIDITSTSGSIHGIKYEDLNANGQRDEGELGLDGVEIRLLRVDTGEVYRDTTKTREGEPGNYQFENVDEGEYYVSETVPEGFVPTAPGFFDGLFGPIRGHRVLLSEGERADSLNFGNHRPGSISGLKYHDLNRNGLRDENEPGLKDWRICLDEDRDGRCSFSERGERTDSTGKYVLKDLLPGEHHVREDLIDDKWIPISPENGLHIVVLNPGEHKDGVDFGNLAATGNVLVWKFDDQNGNRTPDPSEAFLSDWIIFLDKNNNGLRDSDEKFGVSNDTGFPAFIRDVEPGTYYVREELQDGWVQKAPATGVYMITVEPGGVREVPFFGNQQVETVIVQDTGDGEALHQAIEESNSQPLGNPVIKIQFDEVILKASGQQEQRIVLQRPLPPITRPLVIDGGGTVVLDGSQAGENGFHIATSSVDLTGLVITGFAGHGVVIEGDNNRVLRSAITGNDGDGIHVASGSGNAVLGTTFSGNGGLAIDLGGDGPTANDASETDGVQNAPVITSVTLGSTMIEGTLESTPEHSFVIELFASAACGSAGLGEAETFLGSEVVLTDTQGKASFSTTLDTTLTRGDVVTATATRLDGSTSELSPCSVTTGIEREPEAATPTAFHLHANYPNPFNPTTQIRFDVAVAADVRLDVVDLQGRVVRVLADTSLKPGSYYVVFEANGMPSSVYFVRLYAGSFRAAKPMILLK